MPNDLFEKWSTLGLRIFYAIPFQKLVFLVSLYSECLEKQLVCFGEQDSWKDSFVTKTAKLCNIIPVRKIIEFYRKTESKKSNI